MSALLLVELRRGLARRLVRVLVGLSVLAIVIGGVVVFSKSSREPVVTEDRRYHLTSLWENDGSDDSNLAGVSFVLVVGAILCGASVAGADWRSGTMTSQLTWEPRRVRVHVAKGVAYAGAAFVIALLLEAVFCLALTPAAVWRGTTAGADAAWFRHLAGGALRIAALAAMGAGFGYSLAMIGRTTSAALIGAFAYLAVLEGLLRAWHPGWQRWFFSENSAVLILGHNTSDASFERGVVAAGLLIASYTIALWLIALVAFTRRDVT
jgi:hypothetical protein